MPRKYQRKASAKPRGKWTEEQLVTAVEKVKSKEISKREAERRYGVPARTIERRIQSGKLTKGSLGPEGVLGNENEKRMVIHIKKLCQAGFAPDRSSVRKMAFNFAEKLMIKHKFSSETGKAGIHWLRSFMERNPELSIRQSEGLSLARAKGMNRLEVDGFFKLLTSILVENDLINHPSNIFNMDEAGIQLINKPSKVIAPKGAKDVHILTSRERGENITVIGCCNAEGMFLPPVLILKGVNQKPEFSDGLPAGSAVYMNKKSSFITSELFLKWLREHFIPRKPRGKTLLIMDGHASHCSDIEMLEIADQNNIILLCLPSHCTQAMQPLDKSFFGPLKTYWNQESSNWMLNHLNRNLTRYQAGKIIGKAWIRAATATNATSGFRSTGIFPLDQNAIPDHFYAISDLSSQIETNNSFTNQPPSQDLQTLNRHVSEPQPSTSNYHSDADDVTPTKFLQDIRPVPIVPFSLNKKKRSATVLTSPENISLKKEKVQKGNKKVVTLTKNQKKANKKKAKYIKPTEIANKRMLDHSNESDEEPLARKIKKPEKKSAGHMDSESENCEEIYSAKKKNFNQRYYCVECFEEYSCTTKTVDWICCIRCSKWLHETCTMYLTICNICKREEMKKMKIHQ